mmetsp:Transcript_3056/g.3571  ORF Transcript_3056/g.3571 Transcript_3056/m.3571 type:complete len:85 (+) Transcript_3056:998-1252(+)
MKLEPSTSHKRVLNPYNHERDLIPPLRTDVRISSLTQYNHISTTHTSLIPQALILHALDTLAPFIHNAHTLLRFFVYKEVTESI